MKAKVIATQEVIEVEKHSYDYALGAQTFKDVNSGAIYALYDLEFVDNTYTTTKKIDWEQRRFELVKSVFPIVIQKKQMDYDLTIEQFAANVAIVSINYADAVIAKLKEE